MIKIKPISGKPGKYIDFDVEKNEKDHAIISKFCSIDTCSMSSVIPSVKEFLECFMKKSCKR